MLYRNPRSRRWLNLVNQTCQRTKILTRHHFIRLQYSFWMVLRPKWRHLVDFVVRPFLAGNLNFWNFNSVCHHLLFKPSPNQTALVLRELWPAKVGCRWCSVLTVSTAFAFLSLADICSSDINYRYKMVQLLCYGSGFAFRFAKSTLQTNRNAEQCCQSKQ